MFHPLQRFTELFYAALRVMTGFMFAQHGAQKMFGLLDGHQATTAKMITAGAIEFYGGILILLGLFTVPTAFLSSGLMAFAYFMSHAPRGFWTVLNKGELSVLYCFLFLFMAAYGGGKYSLDALVARRRASRGKATDRG